MVRSETGSSSRAGHLVQYRFQPGQSGNPRGVFAAEGYLECLRLSRDASPKTHPFQGLPGSGRDQAKVRKFHEFRHWRCTLDASSMHRHHANTACSRRDLASNLSKTTLVLSEIALSGSGSDLFGPTETLKGVVLRGKSQPMYDQHRAARERAAMSTHTPPIMFDRTQRLLDQVEQHLGEPMLTYWGSSSGSICKNDVIAMYPVL